MPSTHSDTSRLNLRGDKVLCDDNIRRQSSRLELVGYLLVAGCVISGVALLGCCSRSSDSSHAASDNAPLDVSYSGDSKITPLPPLERAFEGNFATSKVCAQCHSNSPNASAMRDSKGKGIAPFDLWRSTMMANSSRDPLWRAAVSVEIAATPSRRQEIEATCGRCHLPAAADESARQQRPLELTSLLHGTTDNDTLTQIALDGVSCTVCHQIEPAGLGTPASFSGGFQLGTEKKIYGPHDNPFAMPMRRFSGFTPTENSHMLNAELCGACHTLYTHAYNAKGEVVHEQFPEQTPFLEWLNSDFYVSGKDSEAAGQTCQDCHMPKTEDDGSPIHTRIVRNPGGRDFPAGRVRGREPYGQHVFVGGNTLMLSILRDNPETLQPNALVDSFDRTIQLTREQLRQRTAKLRIVGAELEKGKLQAEVEIENLTGHKFPTAHPTRRAWLRLRVIAANGEVLFASGDFDAQGRILDGAGMPLPSENVGGEWASHRQIIRSENEVQLYESVMGDEHGELTFLLLRATRYLKDNRLLPHGWQATHPAAADTTPIGTENDSDFVGGGDRVRYQIAVPHSRAPFTVEATLLYQTLGARYAAQLLENDTPQVEEFRGYYRNANPQPEVIAETRGTVGERL